MFCGFSVYFASFRVSFVDFSLCICWLWCSYFVTSVFVFDGFSVCICWFQCLYQTTRAPQEDMAPTDEGRHGGRGCYPGCGPRPEGVEKEDKADPYEIGKRPPR